MTGHSQSGLVSTCVSVTLGRTPCFPVAGVPTRGWGPVLWNLTCDTRFISHGVPVPLTGVDSVTCWEERMTNKPVEVLLPPRPSTFLSASFWMFSELWALPGHLAGKFQLSVCSLAIKPRMPSVGYRVSSSRAHLWNPSCLTLSPKRQGTCNVVAKATTQNSAWRSGAGRIPERREFPWLRKKREALL